MELGGVLGLDSFMVGSSSSLETSEAAAAAMKQKCLFGGARFLKHGRSSASSEPLQVEQQEDDKWNNYNTTTTKVATTDHHQPGPAAAPFLFGSNFHSHSHSLFPEGEQMLSFSSSSSTSTATTSRPNANANVNALMLSSINGIISGSSNVNVNVNMNMNMNMQQQQQGGGVRGPFTPSQWMELEYQALIYKHIDDNVPVPPSLLIPIRRRSINQSTLSNYPPAGSFRSNTPLGWGSCNGNVDPEPGRCRRTDGKKWRCSRDAVADQKYCERHMNRGRHRSRKLVEGHSGQLASSKTIPPLMITISSQHSTSAVSSGPIFLLPQAKCLQPNFSDPSSPSSQLNRIVMSEDNLKESIQDSQGLSLLTAVSTKPAGNNSLVPPILKHHNNNNNNNPFEAHDSLKYPLRSSSSENISSFDYYYSSQLEEDRNNHHPHPLRHFIDDWPKTQPEHQPITWPELELEDMKSDRDRTQLSSVTDFSSSTSSPNQEKLALSPLRLSSWIPIISWEFPTILGGPLGEALTNTNSSSSSSSSRSKDLNFSKNYSSSSSSSSLNHLTSDGWDSSSPRLDSSPTGVLQKTSTIGSLSSSTGSGPTRTDSLKVFDSSSNMCDDDLLGSYTLNI